jgi:hypothetical protein
LKKLIIRWFRKYIQGKGVAQYAEEARVLVFLGAPYSGIVEYLYSEGLTISESISVFNRVGRGEIDSKTVVASHPVWREVVSGHSRFHSDLVNMFKNEKGE